MPSVADVAEAKEEGVKEMGQWMADVVATQQAEHADKSFERSHCSVIRPSFIA